MAVKVIPLESGKFMIKWDSMEKEQPDCVNYEIVLEKGTEYRILGISPAKRGQKEYFIVVENLPKDIVIHIKALKAKNKPTKTEAIAVYP